MDTTPIQDVLRELRFSADMPQEVIEQLAAESSLLRAGAGTVVFREGSPNSNLYLVRSGRLALEMSVPGRGANTHFDCGRWGNGRLVCSAEWGENDGHWSRS